MKMIIFPPVNLWYSFSIFLVQPAAGFDPTVNLKLNAHYSVCKVGHHPANQHKQQGFSPGTEAALAPVVSA